MGDTGREINGGWLRRQVADYSDAPKPLTAYATLIAVFNGAFAAFLWLVKRRDRRLPERISPGDLLLLGVATHRFSRMLAKDRVTGVLRSPFTEFEGAGDIASEVVEKPRGQGFRYAMGELVT